MRLLLASIVHMCSKLKKSKASHNVLPKCNAATLPHAHCRCELVPTYFHSEASGGADWLDYFVCWLVGCSYLSLNYTSVRRISWQSCWYYIIVEEIGVSSTLVLLVMFFRDSTSLPLVLSRSFGFSTWVCGTQRSFQLSSRLFSQHSDSVVLLFSLMWWWRWCRKKVTRPTRLRGNVVVVQEAVAWKQQ